MGHIQHHAIVVTGFNASTTQRAADEADRIGLVRTPIVNSPVNGYCTFCVVPDGSKSGWADDERGDAERAQFKSWLVKSGGYLDWVEVAYSPDDRIAEVSDSTWEREARIEREAGK